MEPEHASRPTDGEGELCAPGPTTVEAISAATQANLDALPLGIRCVEGNAVLAPDIVDLSKLSELEEVRGDVVVADVGGVTELSLPLLRRVTGSFHIGTWSVDESGIAASQGNGNLQTMLLPALREVGQDLVVAGNEELERVVLGEGTEDSDSALGGVTVKRSFVLAGNAKLADTSELFLTSVFDSALVLDNGYRDTAGVILSFAGLKDIGELPSGDELGLTRLAQGAGTQLDGRVPPGSAYFGVVQAVTPNYASITIDLPDLRTVDQNLTFQLNGVGMVNVPELESAGALEVSFGDGMKTFSAPSLSELTGAVTENEPALYLYDLPDLDELQFENLETIAGRLMIVATGLRSLCGLSAVTRIIGDVDVRNNALLPSCQVTGLAERVGTVGDGHLVTDSGNDTTSPCSSCADR